MRRRPVATILKLVLPAFLTAAVVVGCASEFKVTRKPIPPEHRGSFRSASPSIPVTVQVTNFSVGDVDTRYSDEEKTAYREHFALAIPNLLQEALGEEEVLTEVTRVDTASPSAADYIVSGDYNYFERVGTGGREWIPFAGLFGAPINEASVKGDMGVWVIDAKTGQEVFHKRYPEEHKTRTSIYKSAQVEYLQPDYMKAIASDIVEAIRKLEAARQLSSRVPEPRPLTGS